MTPIARTASAAERERWLALIDAAIQKGYEGRMLGDEYSMHAKCAYSVFAPVLSTLQATNAALEKDATRYRWLRDHGHESDREVDAAIATSAGERKGEG